MVERVRIPPCADSGRVGAAHAFFSCGLAQATQGAPSAEAELWAAVRALPPQVAALCTLRASAEEEGELCLLYTSDAADDM
eukprot:7145524-Prymnesium_polylepis.1